MARDTAIYVNDEELERLEEAANAITGGLSDDLPRGRQVEEVANWVLDRREEVDDG